MAQDTPPRDANCSEVPLFIQVWEEHYEARGKNSKPNNDENDDDSND